MLIFMLASFGLPKNITKKVNKEISSVFEISDFSTEMITVSEGINTKLPTKIKPDNLMSYRIAQHYCISF